MHTMQTCLPALRQGNNRGWPALLAGPHQLETLCQVGIGPDVCAGQRTACLPAAAPHGTDNASEAD